LFEAPNAKKSISLLPSASGINVGIQRDSLKDVISFGVKQVECAQDVQPIQ
jgi:hypothetical protein